MPETRGKGVTINKIPKLQTTRGSRKEDNKEDSSMKTSSRENERKAKTDLDNKLEIN